MKTSPAGAANSDRTSLAFKAHAGISIALLERIKNELQEVALC